MFAPPEATANTPAPDEVLARPEPSKASPLAAPVSVDAEISPPLTRKLPPDAVAELPA
jgi:hypothetical protein